MARPTRTSLPTIRSRASRYWAAVILLTLSCGRTGEPTEILRASDGPSAAKGGGSGGGSGSTSLAVTSTSPAQAPQDTALDVTINGSGFTSGAKATWSLNGDTTLVHVQSTKYVSSAQLVAHLLVPGTAPVASYDVQVTLTSGKKGVGAEMFAVTPADPKAQLWFPLADNGLGLKSDHLSAYIQGDSSAYTDGVCGVQAKIFATTAASNSGDATMNTHNPRFGDPHCRDYPRTMTIDFGDGSAPEVSTVFINVHDIQRDNDPNDQIPLGATQLRPMGISETRCGNLLWKLVTGDGTPTGADKVQVTRIAEGEWLVTTQPYPDDKAYCQGDGQLYHVPVRFSITRLAP